MSQFVLITYDSFPFFMKFITSVKIAPMKTVTTVIKKNVIIYNFHKHAYSIIIKEITSYNQVTVTTVSVLIV